LVSAITDRYPHVSGDSFIQKMVQLPFRVPPLNLDKTDFLSALVPNWSAEVYGLPGTLNSKAFSSHIHEIATLGLDANPRQIKRLVNSFLLLQRVVVSQSLPLDLRLLVALIGVQLKWPDYYHRFQEAVLAEDAQEPFKIFTDAEEQPALVRYAQRLLNKTVPNDLLRQILHLTAVVVADRHFDAANLDMSSAERREANRKALRAELPNWGFVSKRGSANYFYSEMLPDIRFYFAHNFVRCDKRMESDATGKAKWVMWESYSLSDEAHLVLKVIQQPDKHFTSQLPAKASSSA
jgi:hypothetical protein